MLRGFCGRLSIRPANDGSGTPPVDCFMRSRCSRLSISTTKKSMRPSRSTSEKSTPMEAKLVLRRARGAAMRKRPLPSLIQMWSGLWKSLHTYRSGSPSPSMSWKRAASPHSSGASFSGSPSSSRNAPSVNGTGVKRPVPSFTYSRSGSASSSLGTMPPWTSPSV